MSSSIEESQDLNVSLSEKEKGRIYCIKSVGESFEEKGVNLDSSFEEGSSEEIESNNLLSEDEKSKHEINESPDLEGETSQSLSKNKNLVKLS